MARLSPAGSSHKPHVEWGLSQALLIDLSLRTLTLPLRQISLTFTKGDREQPRSRAYLFRARLERSYGKLEAREKVLSWIKHTLKKNVVPPGSCNKARPRAMMLLQGCVLYRQKSVLPSRTTFLDFCCGNRPRSKIHGLTLVIPWAAKTRKRHPTPIYRTHSSGNDGRHVLLPTEARPSHPLKLKRFQPLG